MIDATARPRALITGVTGQDDSYLDEPLLEKGYEVHGLIHRTSPFNMGRTDHLNRDSHEAETRLFLHDADLTDSSSLMGHLHRIKPAEVYNLGAQSHVKVSFEMSESTADTAAMSSQPGRCTRPPSCPRSPSGPWRLAGKLGPRSGAPGPADPRRRPRRCRDRRESGQQCLTSGRDGG